eukprot:4153984-Karenia_brevis.AAC.1
MDLQRPSYFDIASVTHASSVSSPASSECAEQVEPALSGSETQKLLSMMQFWKGDEQPPEQTIHPPILVCQAAAVRAAIGAAAATALQQGADADQANEYIEA